MNYAETEPNLQNVDNERLNSLTGDDARPDKTVRGVWRQGQDGFFGICLANSNHLTIFKHLSYFFEETIGFNVNALFVSRPVLRLIRWYNTPGDITKEISEKAIYFHGTFHGLKITNCNACSQKHLPG